MSKSTTLIAVLICALLLVLAAVFTQLKPDPTTTIVTSQTPDSARDVNISTDGYSDRSARRFRLSPDQSTPESGSSNSVAEFAVKETLNRLRSGQFDEALLELDYLLERYEDLNDEEKFTLVNGYANYFLARRQFQEVIDLYVLSLEMEGISQEERIKIYRTLGQLSLYLQQYEIGTAYFDEYFANGGAVDSVVSLTLARSHQNIGNDAEAFAYLYQHIALAVEEGANLRPELYARTYSELDDLIFSIENRPLAIELANEMANIFDTPEAWRNLSEIYLLDGQDENHERVVSMAEEREFIEDGEWVE